MSLVLTDEKAGPLHPDAGTAFLRACRYELRHLAGLRSTWIVMAVLAALSLSTVAVGAFSIKSSTDVATADMVDLVTGSPQMLQVPDLAFFLIVFGTGPVATEMLRGAARTTWLTVPGRQVGFWAKCATGSVLSGTLALVLNLLGVGMILLVLAARGITQPDWAALIVPQARELVWVCCWMMLCTSLAALLRNRVAPVLALVLLPVAGERLLGLLLTQIPGMRLPESASAWLPFHAGTDFLTWSGSDAAGKAAVFLAFTAVLTAAGYSSYLRRSA
ncbi:hypothetical protein [Streptomyces sp. NPDC001340]